MRPRLSSLAVRRALLAILLACGAASAYAQIWTGGGRGYPPRWPTPADFDGSWIYCRGYYQPVRREQSGSGWNTDYPNAEHNFSVRLQELTRVRIKFDVGREPHFVVMPLTEPLLFRCPMLFMEDVGTIRFSEQEVLRLREYLLKGGFLWVDDSWGSYAWTMWMGEIRRVLPPGEFPIFDIPLDHPIMHTLYDVKEIPQVPSINFWSNNGGDTSERGWDSATVYFKGIQDSRGRLMVLMSHNTDIADTWEREGESRQYFDLFSPRGYAIGVNVVLYALTH
jgi:Domain of unknown function (DUF4159)